MIAVDAMGGDFAPDAIVQGAILAAKRGIPVTLFGDDQIIKQILKKSPLFSSGLPLSIFPTTQQISMHETASRAVVKKKDSSLVAGLQAVHEGRAKAFVSAGNSGATLVASTLMVGRVSGVLRPAIAGFIPSNTRPLLCIDLGANTDCKPQYLKQFALMGHLYCSVVSGLKLPRVALLSNGHEPYKGNGLVKQAYELLYNCPELNFVGNIEARDVFDDRADVLVCDGFSGNILLKAAQGTAKAVMRWVKNEAQQSFFHGLLLRLNATLFKRVKNKVDYARSGGALLLGVNHPVVIAHGCSTSQAIENAIAFAHDIVKKKQFKEFNAQLASLIEKTDQNNSAVAKKMTSLFRWINGQQSPG